MWPQRSTRWPHGAPGGEQVLLERLRNLVRRWKHKNVSNHQRDSDRKRVAAALWKKETLFWNIERKQNKKFSFSFLKISFIYYNTQRTTLEVRWFVHWRDWMRADFIRSVHRWMRNQTAAGPAHKAASVAGPIPNTCPATEPKGGF